MTQQQATSWNRQAETEQAKRVGLHMAYVWFPDTFDPRGKR